MRARLLLFILLLASSLAAAQSAVPALSALEGKTATLALLSAVSSKLPPDASFRARLESAVQVGNLPALPQGTIFEGHLEPTRARRRLRSGSLRLVFDRIVMPDGTIRTASLSLTSVRYQSVTTDFEGTIRPRRSKKRLLFQFGGAALIAKLADDLSELASASVTKNSARYFGLGGAAAFLLLQRGGDVKIPQGTELDVIFNRENPPSVGTPGDGAEPGRLAEPAMPPR
jgi:hypothetical protein